LLPDALALGLKKLGRIAIGDHLPVALYFLLCVLRIRDTDTTKKPHYCGQNLLAHIPP
jgi:hypothetical protein